MKRNTQKINSILKGIRVLALTSILAASFVSCESFDDSVGGKADSRVDKEIGIVETSDDSRNEEIVKQVREDTKKLGDEAFVTGYLEKTMFNCLTPEYKKDYVERYLRLKYGDENIQSIDVDTVYELGGGSFSGVYDFESDAMLKTDSDSDTFSVIIDQAGNIRDTRSFYKSHHESKLEEQIKEDIESKTDLRCNYISVSLMFRRVPRKDFTDSDSISDILNEKDMKLMVYMEVTTDTELTDSEANIIKDIIPSESDSGLVEIYNATGTDVEYLLNYEW